MSTLNTQTSLQSRIDLYLEYKQAYYSGEPLISDEEFDEFEQELINDGYDPVVGTVYEISSERKASHRTPMLSLGKKKVYGDEMPMELAIELFEKYGDGELSFKYDGMAINAEYTNGVLHQIVTRGNGLVGTNQTEKLKHLFPQKLSNPISVDIRCELVMSQSLFKSKYSKENGGKYSHSRNLVAGICNDINIEDIRKFDLDIVVLEGIIGDNVVNPSTFHPVFSEKYKEHKRCFSASDVKLFFDHCHQTRSTLSFGTDGTVYSSIGSKFEKNGNKPKHAVSIKFAPPRLISRITDIKWKLHKTGRYTPKVFFEPIIVDGREIKQASGHNLEYLVKNNLVVGSKIDVILSNDIIPMITSYKEEIYETL